MQFTEFATNAYYAMTGNPLTTILVFFTIVLLALVFWLSFRLDRLTRGGDGRSIESTLTALSERLKKVESHAVGATKRLHDHESRITRSVRGISVKRFDPFGGSGGQQSFATAFVNEQGDGVVISGIHSRDGVRVYAKEVKHFSSERELSEEEREAIQSTQSSLS
jgi:hypothetical protein